jgi:hypothetical protein
LAAENRILKARLQPGWRLSDGERATLAEIGKRLGRKGLEQVARLAKPDTEGKPGKAQCADCERIVERHFVLQKAAAVARRTSRGG